MNKFQDNRSNGSKYITTDDWEVLDEEMDQNQ